MRNRIVIILFICCNNLIFSQEETWLAIGFDFGNYIEHNNNENAYIPHLGFNISGYEFENKKDIGIFVHHSFLFPVGTNGDYNFQWEFISGPGFRHHFNENLKLQFGVGPALTLLTAKYVQDSLDYSKFLWGVGVGADVGIKYDVNEYFYLNAGVTFSYIFAGDMAHYSSAKTSNDQTIRTRITDGWIKGYGLFGIKPYLCVGFNFYQEKGRWGKPKPQ
ncbi:MAG: hypothetical protein LBL45_04365 [Treponema sp.]|jgi:hypothetical protein|nr:hypothetical protein [Treponema sp.]